MTIPQRVHLIGIGGTGLSAIARVLLEKGHMISGSDRQFSHLAANLEAAGARIFTGHAAENIGSCELVVRSSAILDSNPEVVAARERGIPVMKRDVFLGELLSDKKVIAVAGSHGKTTTTAMLAWTFTQLGQDPSFIVGGVISDLGANAHAGKGPHFIIEADEYDRMFHGLQPSIAIITNVEHDHPDCYPTPEDFFQAFSIFIEKIPAGGSLVYCADDAGAARLALNATQPVMHVAYGLENAQLACRADHLQPNQHGGFSCDVQVGTTHCQLDLSVPGLHNVRNALAVLAAVSICKLDLQKAAAALNKFSGAGRRFEVRGEAAGMTIIDDYGHHPTEIRATLAGARARYPEQRIIAVWQPHTFSRTQTLFSDFVHAFDDADQVIITEIYPSREQPPAGGYSSLSLVNTMNLNAKAHNGGITRKETLFAANLLDAVSLILQHALPGDIIVILSAGDADWIGQQVLNQLEERKQNHV